MVIQTVLGDINESGSGLVSLQPCQCYTIKISKTDLSAFSPVGSITVNSDGPYIYLNQASLPQLL